MADSGNVINFKFCSDCGSTIYWENSALPDHYIVAVGSFGQQSAAFPQPEFSVYEARKHSWVLLSEGIEHME